MWLQEAPVKQTIIQSLCKAVKNPMKSGRQVTGRELILCQQQLIKGAEIHKRSSWTLGIHKIGERRELRVYSSSFTLNPRCKKSAGNSKIFRLNATMMKHTWWRTMGAVTCQPLKLVEGDLADISMHICLEKNQVADAVSQLEEYCIINHAQMRKSKW